MNERLSSATRVMNGVTASLEKRCWCGSAHRLPPSIHSDHLTALAGSRWRPPPVPMSGRATGRRRSMLVNVALALNWFGDSLDGTWRGCATATSALRLLRRPRARLRGHRPARPGNGRRPGLMSLTMSRWRFSSPISSCRGSLPGHLLPGVVPDVVLGLGRRNCGMLLAVGNVAAIARPVVTLFGETWRLFDVGAACRFRC